MNPILHLHLTTSKSIESEIEVSSQKTVTIGRDASCDISLAQYYAQVSSTVSRVHCQISYQNGHFFITDKSMNGTWVNGYRLMTGQAKALSDGDVIGITSDPELILSAQIHQPQERQAKSAGAEDTQPLVEPLFLSLLYELQKGSDVILLGVAGAGKTTLMRKLMPPPPFPPRGRRFLSAFGPNIAHCSFVVPMGWRLARRLCLSFVAC